MGRARRATPARHGEAVAEERGHRLPLDGGSAAFLEAGAGPAIVAVHGLAMGGRFWSPLLPLFARRGLRVIAPDLPGFGGSTRWRGGAGVPETADWLLRLADALELERPTWLGHSLGSQPALELAARAPDRAGALILVSPTGAPVHARALRQLTNLLRDMPHEPAALVGDVAHALLGGPIPATLSMWLAAARHDPLRSAPSVQAPTLIVSGDADPVARIGFVRRLARAMPDATLDTMAGERHGLIITRAFTIVDAIAAFLSRRPG